MKRVVLLTFVLALSAAALSATVKGTPERREPGSVPVARAPVAAQPAPPAVGAGHEGNGAPEPQHGQEPARAEAPAEGTGAHAEVAEHEAEAAESPWATVARLFNFVLLAGILVYLLRSPFAAFLEARGVQIRKDLTDASATRETAAHQLAEIDRRLEALPAELDALRQRGKQEIAAEEARIRAAAEAERDRMLDNARRDIGRRAQIAERRLVRLVADLAVNAATARVRGRITDDDQRRLVDRYLDQVRAESVGS